MLRSAPFDLSHESSPIHLAEMLRPIRIDSLGLRATLDSDALRRLCAGHLTRKPLVPAQYLLGLMAEMAEMLATNEEPALPHTLEAERCRFVQEVDARARVTLTARRDPRHPDCVAVLVEANGEPAAHACFGVRD